MGVHSGAIFIPQSDIVGANRDKAAIGNLALTMERKPTLQLAGDPWDRNLRG